MALPSYKSAQTHITLLMREVSEHASREANKAFQESPVIKQHEGHKITFIYPDGKSEEVQYKRAESEFTLSKKERANLTLNHLMDIAHKVGSDIGGQKLQHGLDEIQLAAENAGNLVQKGSQPLTLDAFLDAFEKLHISFDEDENPIMPNIMIPESQQQNVYEVLDLANWSDKDKKRRDDILAKKLEEWREQENNRKLVD